MFVTSLVAVLLAGGGLVAVMVFANGGDGDQSGTEDCLPGTWELTAYTQQVPGSGSGELVDGTPVFTFNPDGTGTADYGDGTVMRTEVFGVPGDVTVTGSIGFRYQPSGGTLQILEQRSSANMDSELEIPGFPVPDEYTLPEGPLNYTCDGDDMTFSDGEQNFELQRAG